MNANERVQLGIGQLFTRVAELEAAVEQLAPKAEKLDFLERKLKEMFPGGIDWGK